METVSWPDGICREARPIIANFKVYHAVSGACRDANRSAFYAIGNGVFDRVFDEGLERKHGYLRRFHLRRYGNFITQAVAEPRLFNFQVMPHNLHLAAERG